MFTVIKNVHIYAPEDLGICDILIAGKKIEKISPNITLPNEYVNVIDAKGKYAVPGYIDQHVHIIGGGGEAGFRTRAPEIMLGEFIKAGITTVLGLLGTDSETRSVENLLAKAKALNEEGMTAMCLTGSYAYPSPTITGSIKTDITFISEIIGVKLAISDHRSSFVDADILNKIVADVRVGGMIGNKAGIVTLHMGDDPAGLKLIRQVLSSSTIPKKHFVPTHCNRNPHLLEDALAYCKDGGNMDLSAGSRSDGPLSPPDILNRMKNEKYPLNKVTISTDGNGSYTRYDDEGNVIKIGVASVSTLHKQVKRLVEEFGFSLGEAVTFVTKNVAHVLMLQKEKGTLKEGFDADILLIDSKNEIDSVWMNGTCMMKDKVLLKKGTYEN